MIKKISIFFLVFVPVFLLVQYFLFDTLINLKMLIQAGITGVLSVIIFLLLEKRIKK